MKLIEFDADDTASVATFVDLDRAASVVDCPWEQPRTTYRQQMSIRNGFDGEVGRYFLVQVDDTVVGTAVMFASDYDNLDLAWVEVVIRPDLRRSGHGRAALDLILDRCRAAGRSLALLYGWESPAARAFAASSGFAEKSAEIRRIQSLDHSPAERARIVALHDSALALAGDYDLIRIAGRTPEDLLPDLIAAVEAINDAPRDGLDFEDERYDVDRVRAYEAAQEATGFRLYRVVARHRVSGAIAGHTVISVDSEQPAWGEQHDTTVVPEHRGHRLGLLLKSAMVMWLLESEPELRQILTENAETNGPMIDVNETLGYHAVGRQLLFQRRL